jgi:molybdate transport system ATP-binding protein
MTVEQNIKVTAKNPDSAAKYMNQFGLTGKENCFPSFLSGGEQQRVALARLLASEPEVFLFDEPFSALDNHRKAELERLLLDLLEEKNLPAILVTHDRNEAFRLSNKIAAMEKGTLSVPQEKHLFFENPKTLATARLTGCKNITRLIIKGEGIFAVDWGIALSLPALPRQTATPYAGFRAHYFQAALFPDEENTFTCDIKRVIEDTFSFIICFTQKGNTVNTKDSLLCWEVTKDEWKEIEPRAKSGTLYAKLDMSKILFLGETE